MKKNIFLILSAACALVAVIIFVSPQDHRATNGDTPVVPVAPLTDPRNTPYKIDGESITLKDGTFTREVAPGSASKETFAIFGEPVYGDQDGDGDMDAAMYLTRDGGGSGTFFYVVVAQNEGGTYKGSNAVFLGDRIAPQNISIDKGNALVNYADRKPGEAFTAQPSVGKSMWLHLDPKTGEIGELVKDFEGEADPSKMTLTMNKWNWIRTDYQGGKSVTPAKADKFSLTLKEDGTFSATTDCNGAGGEYSAKGSTLTFSKMMSTLMFCEGSQEGEFTAALGETVGYHFTGKGELILELKDNKGTVTLR